MPESLPQKPPKSHFFCRNDLYEAHFKHVFDSFYSSNNELGAVLDRLVCIRNKLSHRNTISIHEAEQALCYSDDIINCFKVYYHKIGKTRKYNVPYFVNAKDSLGNVFIREDPECAWEIWHLPKGDWQDKVELRSGDSYKIWVEIDGAFPEDYYTVDWVAVCGSRVERGLGNAAEIALCDSDVSFGLSITFSLTTSNSWHKHANQFNRSLDYDDRVEWRANQEVLPPIESAY